MRSSGRLAAVRCFVPTGYSSWPPRYAYPTASAPRSAIAASSACAASVRSTPLRALRLYPAIPHIRFFLDGQDPRLLATVAWRPLVVTDEAPGRKLVCPCV